MTIPSDFTWDDVGSFLALERVRKLDRDNNLSLGASLALSSYETTIINDGGGLVATHYCSMGNQPRMKAAAPIPAGDSISFRFVDVTNLKKPGSGHIKHLTVKFVDADHFVQEWTHTDGKKEETMAFRWTRKK